MAEVMPIKLLMTSCQSQTDMIAIHGVDKEQFTRFRDYDVAPAALAAFRADDSGALVGEKIADRYGWKVGQPVTLPDLNNISFTVRGVFSTGGTPDDHLIFTDRFFLQQADRGGDEVVAGKPVNVSNRVLIRLNPGEDADVACAAIDGLPMTIQTVTQSEDAFLATSLDQLSDLVAVSKLVIGGIIVVILIAMGNAVSMAVRQRRAELGVLRTLGFQRSSILAMVVIEAGLQALIGGVLGCVGVYVVISANLIKTVSTCGLTVTLTAGSAALTLALAAIVAAAMIGSIVPAWNVSRCDIPSAIRRED